MQVVTHDERLSTVDAKARLFEKGGYKSLSKSNVDNMSGMFDSRKLVRSPI